MCRSEARIPRKCSGLPEIGRVNGGGELPTFAPTLSPSLSYRIEIYFPLPAVSFGGQLDARPLHSFFFLFCGQPYRINPTCSKDERDRVETIYDISFLLGRKGDWKGGGNLESSSTGGEWS